MQARSSGQCSSMKQVPAPPAWPHPAANMSAIEPFQTNASSFTGAIVRLEPNSIPSIGVGIETGPRRTNRRVTPLPARSLCLVSALSLATPTAAFAAQPSGEPVAEDPQPAEDEDSQPAEDEIAPPPAPAESADPLAGAEGLDPQGMVDAEKAAYAAYMKGIKLYEEGRFEDAAAVFDEALRTLPDLPPYGRSRGALGLWRARCLGQMYALTGDTALLDQEEGVLRAYAGRLREAATDDVDRDRKLALVNDRLQEIATERERQSSDHGDVDTQLERSLEGGYQGTEASDWAPRTDDLAWQFRPDDPRPRSRQEDDGEKAPEKLVMETDDGAQRKPGTGFIVGGAVAMAAGLGGLGVMGAGMAQAAPANDFDPLDDPMTRREQIARGERGNVMSVVGLSVGGALLITGIALVAVGVKRRRAGNTALSWGVGPGGGHIGLEAAF